MGGNNAKKAADKSSKVEKNGKKGGKKGSDGKGAEPQKRKGKRGGTVILVLAISRYLKKTFGEFLRKNGYCRRRT